MATQPTGTNWTGTKCFRRPLPFKIHHSLPWNMAIRFPNHCFYISAKIFVTQCLDTNNFSTEQHAKSFLLLARTSFSFRTRILTKTFRRDCWQLFIISYSVSFTAWNLQWIKATREPVIPLRLSSETVNKIGIPSEL